MRTYYVPVPTVVRQARTFCSRYIFEKKPLRGLRVETGTSTRVYTVFAEQRYVYVVGSGGVMSFFFLVRV